MKSKIALFIMPIIILSLLIGFNVLANEPESEEEVTAEDLGISEPKTLPNSPFYFLKNFWRQLKLTFTFNSVKKAELRLQFASEMLLEAQRLAEESDNPEIFEKAIGKYQKQVDKLQNKVEQIQEQTEETAEDNPKIDSFLNRFNRKIELHEQLMEKLEEQVGNEQAQERVRETKERTIQHLNQVKEKLIERFRNQNRNCKNLCGDGICQEIVCMATNCPCPETPITCPGDCEEQ